MGRVRVGRTRVTFFWFVRGGWRNNKWVDGVTYPGVVNDDHGVECADVRVG